MSRNDRADKFRRNAQGYFNQSQKRDELLKDELEKERNAEKAKIARLRAERLAKEAGGPDQETPPDSPESSNS